MFGQARILRFDKIGMESARERESIEMCLETAFVIQSTARPDPGDKFRGLNGQTPL